MPQNPTHDEAQQGQTVCRSKPLRALDFSLRRPETGGACRYRASPGAGKGWSYIKGVTKFSVIVEEYSGAAGKNVTRLVPLAQLHAVMAKVEVDAARIAESLMETNGTGFFLRETIAQRWMPEAAFELDRLMRLKGGSFTPF